MTQEQQAIERTKQLLTQALLILNKAQDKQDIRVKKRVRLEKAIDKSVSHTINKNFI